MANWKKIIVSGSTAELNHITASGNVSASGNLFGLLPEDSALTRVVVYNATTGRLEQKILNLVNSQKAPELFLVDIFQSEGGGNLSWKYSYDSGSQTIPTGHQAFHKLSASLDGGATYGVVASNADKKINSEWNNLTIGDVLYYNVVDDPITNQTASISEGNANGPEDRRLGLLGATDTTPQRALSVTLNSVKSESDTTAVPAPSGAPYKARAFATNVPGLGETGSLEVYINNNATPKATAILTGSSLLNYTLNGVTFNISPSASGNDNGETDHTKAHRSGSFVIETTHQVDGYNYAYAFYTGSHGGKQIKALTNFLEWFYDEEGANNDLSKTDGPTADFYTGEGLDSSEVNYLSGIKYFNVNGTNGARIQKTALCTNQYRNVYPTSGDAIQITTNNNTTAELSVTQSGVNLDTNPTLTDENAGLSTNGVPLAELADVNNAHLTTTRVTASLVPTFFTTANGFHVPNTMFLQSGDGSAPFDDYASDNSQDIELGIRFSHFNKPGSPTAYNQDTISSYLLRTATSASDSHLQLESFRGEEFRIQSRSYAFNEDPATYTYDSTENIGDDGNAGYNKGMLQFASYLVYPTKAGITSDAGAFTTTHGPTQTNDYSSGATQEATGVRSLYRHFKLGVSGTGVGVVAFQLEFKGAGKLTPTTNALVTDDAFFHAYVMRLGDGSSAVNNSAFTSGFVDVLGGSYAGSEALSLNGSNYQHIPLTNTLSSISYSTTTVEGALVTTSTAPVSDNASATGLVPRENIVVRLDFPQGWTGYLDCLGIRYGNFLANSPSVLNNGFGSTTA